MTTFIQNLKDYRKASYPILIIETHEERRLEKEIVETFPDTDIYRWDTQFGLLSIKDRNFSVPKSEAPSKLLEYLLQFAKDSKNNRSIVMLYDFHLQFASKTQATFYIRYIRNMVNLLKGSNITLLMVGPSFVIPTEIEKDVQMLEYRLPDEKGLEERLDYVVDSVNHNRVQKKKDPIVVTDSIRSQSIEAARGMTAFEAEQAFSLSFIKNDGFDDGFVKSVFGEKIGQIRKSGLLEYMETNVTFSDVGGLGELKDWCNKQARTFTPEAKAFGIKTSKGVLINGFGGSGKSLIAKALAHEFKMPIYKWDIANMFDKFVGGSERRFLQAIQLIESLGKVIILMEEIDKTMSKNATSGGGDSGAGSRTYQTVLNWMQDRTNPAFIVATSNDLTLLDPPLRRRGRFNEVWFVDLPSEEELEEIVKVHISRVGRDPSKFDLSLLASKAIGYTGADIEVIVDDALLDAFMSDEELENQHIVTAIERVIPQSKTDSAHMEAIRKEATGNMRMAKSKTEEERISEDFRSIGA